MISVFGSFKVDDKRKLSKIKLSNITRFRMKTSSCVQVKARRNHEWVENILLRTRWEENGYF